MSRHKDEIYLKHILDYAKETQVIALDKRRDDLETDPILRYALLHLICIMGEAANRVSPEGNRTYPQVPWRGIVSMRNMVIHGYDVVDLEILWDTVSKDIPELIKILEQLPTSNQM